MNKAQISALIVALDHLNNLVERVQMNICATPPKPDDEFSELDSMTLSDVKVRIRPTLDLIVSDIQDDLVRGVIDNPTEDYIEKYYNLIDAAMRNPRKDISAQATEVMHQFKALWPRLWLVIEQNSRPKPTAPSYQMGLLGRMLGFVADWHMDGDWRDDCLEHLKNHSDLRAALKEMAIDILEVDGTKMSSVACHGQACARTAIGEDNITGYKYCDLHAVNVPPCNRRGLKQ